MTATIAQKGTELRARRQRGEDAAQQVLSTRLEGETEALRVQAVYLKLDNNRRRVQLHAIILQRVEDGGAGVFYREGALPPGAATDGRAWRFAGVKGERIVLSAGAAVVGDIPRGLPAFDPPAIRWDALPLLLPAAFVMALIGLMEATSISKAIAAKTRQRVDVNKELVGQGLANIAGSFFSAYTVSGSFSRSAVAAPACSPSSARWPWLRCCCSSHPFSIIYPRPCWR